MTTPFRGATPASRQGGGKGEGRKIGAPAPQLSISRRVKPCPVNLHALAFLRRKPMPPQFSILGMQDPFRVIGEAGEYPRFRAGANPLARESVHAGCGSTRFRWIVLGNVKDTHQENPSAGESPYLQL